jgi:pimeloyl-ACP methyl ester carboxylesterase
MHALLPNSTLHIVPGAGHNVHLEKPEAFIEIVNAALT